MAAAGGLMVASAVVAGALSSPTNEDTAIVLHNDALPLSGERADAPASVAVRQNEHLAQAEAPPLDGDSTRGVDPTTVAEPADTQAEPEPEVEEQQAETSEFRPPPGGPSPTGPLGIPQRVLVAYQSAASEYGARCSLAWEVVAAIGRAESDHARGGEVHPDGTTWQPILGPVLDGTDFAAISDSDDGRWDLDVSWDRAVGPMQFLPGTWAWIGVDADRDGSANPQDIDDAAGATARYLCVHGGNLADPDQLRAALLRYNNSGAYADTVLAWADGYAGRVTVVPDPEPTEPGAPEATSVPSTSAGPNPAEPTPAPSQTAAPSASASPTPAPESVDPSEATGPTPVPTPHATADPTADSAPTATPTAAPEPSAEPVVQATDETVPTPEFVTPSADSSTDVAQ